MLRKIAPHRHLTPIQRRIPQPVEPCVRLHLQRHKVPVRRSHNHPRTSYLQAHSFAIRKASHSFIILIQTKETTLSTQELQGLTAVITGGTSGIGHALALGLAQAGANVVASSRSAEACTTTAAELEALNTKTLICPSDVTDRASLLTLRDQVLTRFHAVDILINCAGITQRTPTLSLTEEKWNQIFDTNLTGTLRACQVFAEPMIARRKGRIINIASLSTYVAFLEVTAYCCTKAAIGALTRSLAVEWAPHNIAVNAIAPGIFPTALNSAILDSPRGLELLSRTPAARFGTPSELVSTAVYLASPRTTFTTGQIIPVDGGFLASGVNQ